ncbi:UDP-N-acetylmuramoyl-L-alanine--D-glutamate ligase [Brevibacillus ginsengisoli]|uniref:UDP-N-acetylmuramoyl-L-alanine--D-glutamate ligase n=1 Tax=Brevibacillus ginsengisoli TaxID=363854 RepID=UPI003CE98BB8
MDTYKNQQVVVVGLAKSGVAVAKLLHRFGAHVIVNDKKPREESVGIEELEDLGIQVITGYHPDDLIHTGVSLVVKNPGIPYEAPPVKQAIEQQIPVITEVEIAYQLSKAPIIGITGSNGKTTTTTLVTLMLQASQVDAVAGGNIGTVLCELAEQMSADQFLVAELSSFQLMGTCTFRPKIAALLNLFPAHLDYHHTMEEYFEAKTKIFANQTSEDFAVLNYEQENVRQLADSIKATPYFFSRLREVPAGAFVRDNHVIFRSHTGEEETVIKLDDIALQGKHHLENILAAVIMCKLAGATAAGMAQVLSTFQGVEHRTEFVTIVEGVKYYNDSKATNPQAAIQAISAFQNPVVLIGGGLDRGIDFQELVPYLSQHVRAVVTFGETAQILLDRASDAGISDRVRVDTVEEAVRAAAALANAGDVVLLSPACASWDMFPSFEVRGSMFKEAVHKLRTSLG